MDDNCILELCDPDGMPAGQAIRLARAVSRVEPALAPSLGAYVCHLADSAVSDARSFTATCERVKALGNPVAGPLVSWLAAGAERRLGRHSAPIPPQLGVQSVAV